MATLFKQFQPVSKAAWLAKVEKDLKGKAIEDLNWTIQDDLVIPPFAHADDIAKAYPSLNQQRTTNSWEIGVKVVVGNMQIANQEALNALANGANAIAFELTKSPSKNDLKILLKDIELEWISTHFIFKQKSWKRFISFFLDYIADKKYEVTKLACTFSFKGKMVANSADANRINEIKTQLPKAQLMTINARPLNRGTANIVSEIAQTIAQGNAALLELHQQSLNLNEHHTQIQFSIAIGDSYFLNIAKIRAIKLLWQQILTAWKINSNMPANIEAHLTTSMQTDNENYNKIKATTQAMAAVIGGANRLYIYPSDEIKDGIGTPFAQRIALNIQHLMQLESYMDRVIDPAAGSYYIENLTNQLAALAWKEFQTLA